MKIIALVFFCLLTVSVAARPNVTYSMCMFDNPSGKAFVEVYLNTTVASVLPLRKENGKFHGTIQVLLVIRKDNVIVYSDKYNLLSPEAVSVDSMRDFIDVQRIAVGNGSFRLDLSVTDNNNPGAEKFTASRDFLVDFPTDRISISDIELLESYEPSKTASRFTRNGMDLIPYTTTYYPPGIKSVRFYAEVYRASTVLGPDSAFILRYRIDGYESKKPTGNLGGWMKANAKDVNVLLNEIGIADLASGNYSLVVEAVNKQNLVLASKKVLVQHVGKVIAPLSKEEVAELSMEGSFVELIPYDSLKLFVDYLYPLTSPVETKAASSILERKDTLALRRYFFHFWLDRDRLDPEGAWLEYKGRVDAVNASFSTPNRKGFESDRGRVYLQYGSPNTIDQQLDNAGVYPYEIWQYYTLGTQRNKKFVFKNENRSTNEFELIHSDAIGEIKNPNWLNALSNSQNNFGLGTTDPDHTPSNPLSDDKALDSYKHPK